MSKTKLTFEKLYSISKEELHASKKEFVKKKNERALEAAIDSAKLAKLEAEAAIQNILGVVSKGDLIQYNDLLGQRQIIADAENTIKELEIIQGEFFKN